jgi:hypothetical protein
MRKRFPASPGKGECIQFIRANPAESLMSVEAQTAVSLATRKEIQRDAEVGISVLYAGKLLIHGNGYAGCLIQGALAGP